MNALFKMLTVGVGGVFLCMGQMWLYNSAYKDYVGCLTQSVQLGD